MSPQPQLQINHRYSYDEIARPRFLHIVPDYEFIIDTNVERIQISYTKIQYTNDQIALCSVVIFEFVLLTLMVNVIKHSVEYIQSEYILLYTTVVFIFLFVLANLVTITKVFASPGMKDYHQWYRNHETLVDIHCMFAVAIYVAVMLIVKDIDQDVGDKFDVLLIKLFCYSFGMLAVGLIELRLRYINLNTY
jgi:uncharacterized membrane protein YhdT